MSPADIAQRSAETDSRSVNAASGLAAATYAVFASLWILLTDYILNALHLSPQVEQFVNSTKGLAFVAVTTGVLFIGMRTQLRRLQKAEDQLHSQESGIRQAYVDVLDAVTGGKLVLVTEGELGSLLGDALGEPMTIDDPMELAAARHAIRDTVSEVDSDLAGSMNLMSAVGEALNNALKHGHRGTFCVYGTDDDVQIRIDDEGPGIDFRTLPKATLVAGFSTTSTMGLGFTLMLQLSERVLLFTRPGRTTVVLEFPRGVAASAAASDNPPVAEGDNVDGDAIAQAYAHVTAGV